MKNVLILLLFWFGICLIVAFIDSRVNKRSFKHSLVRAPLILIESMFSSAQSKNRDIIRKAKKEGRDDIVEKAQMYNDHIEYDCKPKTQNIKDKVDNHFNKD